MPSATTAQPLVHPNVLKLRAPHLFDCQPRSRPSHASYRRSPLASPIDNDFHSDWFIPLQCNTPTKNIPISMDVSGSHRSQQIPERQDKTEHNCSRTPVTTLSRNHTTYSRSHASASSPSSPTSSESLSVVIKLLQNSLAETNADKEWLWSVLEDAWADNKKICAALERVKAEKAQVVVECEKLWCIATHHTAELKVLEQKLAQYEASAAAGEEKYVTGSR